MRRRLRKKLQLGEFNWRTFDIRVWPDKPWPDPAWEKLFHAVVDYIHGQSLACGGGLGDPWDLVIESVRPAQWVNRHRRWVHQHCTEEHRTAVAEFLGRCPGVARFEVGPTTLPPRRPPPA